MRILLALSALLVLAACGRVGPIRPPGPQEAIIYPRTYPYIPPASRSGVAAPTGTPVPESLTPGAPPAWTGGEAGDTPISRPGSPR
ncbi:hypothetical protein J8J14_16660 [Roseomonas sp. SSH11]|uniref:Lipoprotein n=1 Tax=Pararoseomonas baculiformis TaxID=2820812 RepID=A0ABS4AIQ5_9PROT|nr:hypothetical protein [Pararoseomonas baculiformis]MBP0446408.1 hypothetical protein [Pararoseomonas baculiformis]